MRIGIDAVSVSRIRRLSRSSRQKLLGPAEEKFPLESQAAAVAAKEAFSKAVGRIPPRWHDIEVCHKEDGSPYIRLSFPLKQKVKECEVSITHEKGLAIAVVVVELAQ